MYFLFGFINGHITNNSSQLWMTLCSVIVAFFVLEKPPYLISYFIGVCWYFAIFPISLELNKSHDILWFVDGDLSRVSKPIGLQSTFYTKISSEIRGTIMSVTQLWSGRWGELASSMICGISLSSKNPLHDLYYNLGVIHLIVISGSHFVLLNKITLFFCSSPFKLLYSIRLISARHYVFAKIICDISCFFIMLIYGGIVNWSPPCQRAFFLTTVHILSRWLLKVNSEDRQIKLALVLQVIFFPFSFFSTSNVLSWSFGLIFESFHLKSKPPRHQQLFIRWIYIAGLQFTLLDSVSFASIIFDFLWGFTGDLIVLLLCLGLFLVKNQLLINVEGILELLHLPYFIVEGFQERFVGGRALSIQEPYGYYLRVFFCMWFIAIFSDILMNTKKHNAL